jgi:hypothetical protein
MRTLLGRVGASVVGHRRELCIWLGFAVIFVLTMFPPWVVLDRDGKLYPSMFPDGENVKNQMSRTYLINISGPDFCETGVAQGVSADLDGRPLGTDRRTVGIGGIAAAPIAA